ncbi:unnamed protein product [Knipowitschia caucasica]
MSHQCNTCQEKLLKLNQQVSVMRKEMKNLRQMLDSATRAHRKQLTSLQSVLTNIDRSELCKAQTPNITSASPVSALEQGVIQTAPIGYIRSCFSAKNGTPRQPTICGQARAELRIQNSVFNNPEHALVGLEQYSHVWVIFMFHKNGHLSAKAKVKPPRLNGQKVGVYSTRSPHRPNALGLTLAKLERIAGDTVYLSDIDMIDGTPVLDIKPYIPEYDSVHYRTDISQSDECPQVEKMENERIDIIAITERQNMECDLVGGANSSDPFSQLNSAMQDVKAYLDHTDRLEGKHERLNYPKNSSKSSSERPCYGEDTHSTIASWIREPPVSSLDVRFTAHAEKQLSEFVPSGCNDQDGPKFQFLRSTKEATAAIKAVLSADPRSVYRRERCTDKLFYFTLDAADVTCWFGQGFAEVLQIRPLHIQLK